MLEDSHEVSTQPSFSRLNSLNFFSLSLQGRCSSPLTRTVTSGFAPAVPCPFHTGAPELCSALQVGSHKGRAEGAVPSLLVLPTFLGIQPRILLVFWAGSAQCQFMVSFSSAITPKSFSAGLLSVTPLPNLWLCLGLLGPRCRTLHLA